MNIKNILFNIVSTVSLVLSGGLFLWALHWLGVEKIPGYSFLLFAVVVFTCWAFRQPSFLIVGLDKLRGTLWGSYTQPAKVLVHIVYLLLWIGAAISMFFYIYQVGVEFSQPGANHLDEAALYYAVTPLVLGASIASGWAVGVLTVLSEVFLTPFYLIGLAIDYRNGSKTPEQAKEQLLRDIAAKKAFYTSGLRQIKLPTFSFASPGVEVEGEEVA